MKCDSLLRSFNRISRNYSSVVLRKLRLDSYSTYLFVFHSIQLAAVREHFGAIFAHVAKRIIGSYIVAV